MSETNLPVISLALSVVPELNTRPLQDLTAVDFGSLIQGGTVDSHLFDQVKEIEPVINLFTFQELPRPPLPVRDYPRLEVLTPPLSPSILQAPQLPSANLRVTTSPIQTARVRPPPGLPTLTLEDLPPTGSSLPVAPRSNLIESLVPIIPDQRDAMIFNEAITKDVQRQVAEYGETKKLTVSSSTESTSLIRNVDQPVVTPEGRTLTVNNLNNLFVPSGPDARILPSSVTTIPVNQQFHQTEAWHEEIAQRLVWMTQNSTPVAKLRINPPDLGVVDVRISVEQDQVKVNFSTPTAEVRVALESALPRLQSLFHESGLQLTDADVQQEPFGQQPVPTPIPERDAPPDSDSEEHVGEVSLIGQNVVDLYI